MNAHEQSEQIHEMYKDLMDPDRRIAAQQKEKRKKKVEERKSDSGIDYVAN